MSTTYSERIESLRLKRGAKITLLEQLHERVAEEARTFSEKEQAAFDLATQECEDLNQQIATLEKLQSISATNARGVIVPNTPNPRDPTGRIAERGMADLPKGTAFARYAMALAAGRGNLLQSAELAKSLWPNSPIASIIKTAAGCGGTSGADWMGMVQKAAVPAGTTTDPAWAGPLVDYRDMVSEFIDLLRPATIIGRINGFRRVPFAVRVPRQTSGSSVGWVGEAQPKPVSKLGFDAITMPFSKIAGIVVITEELARFSSPSAEALVRDDLVETIGTFMDVQFIDPSVVANPAANSPASITNGAQTIASSGSDAASVMDDLTKMQQAIVSNGFALTGLYWIMNPRTKISLANMRTSQDLYAFPTIAANNTLLGFPIVDSASVPIAADATTFIALMASREVLVADDGDVTLDASREASVAMSDDGTGALVSLWQNNLIGLRAERFAHWMPRRNGAVVLLTGVSY